MPLRFAALVFMLAAGISAVAGQSSNVAAVPQAQLKLTMEPATTNRDGNPTSLLVSVTNEGGSDVVMPVLSESDCGMDGGIRVVLGFTPDNAANGYGTGGGSCMGDGMTLVQRIRQRYVRLRPGESLSTTVLLRREMISGAGTVDYFVRYWPPVVRPAERELAWKAGYVVPARRLETDRRSFHLEDPAANP